MKMKKLDYLYRATFAVLIIIFMVAGCKKTGDIKIDPVSYDTLFTFSPLHGFPGNSVVITGSGLGEVTQVGFGSVAGDITAQSASSLTVTVPVGAQTARINLVIGSAILASRTNFVVDATPVPSVIEFDPKIAGSGDVITITGNLLDKVDSVFIGSLKAAITGTPTATSLQVIAPVGLQTAKIRLFYTYMTDYGMLKPAESVSANNLSLALPVISSIEPNITALNINDLVTIKGTMMSEVTKVEFGTINATPITFSGDSMITVNVPVGATTGKIKLTLTDGFVESTTFQVNLPVISNFNPGKGAEASSSTTRAIVIDGTKLDLVTSVTVGSVTAGIQTQTATQMILTIPGNTAGFINLASANGTVKSSIPFFFTGNMWLADYDNMYTPVRLYNEPMYAGVGGSESFQDADGIVKSIGNNGDSHGNFRRFALTFKAASSSPRIYVRGDQGASANPAPDRFLLYTPNSTGVTFEFDISWDAIPAAMVDANSEVDLKLMFFNADQGAGGGYGYYTDHIKVKYDGPGVWKHVTVNTNATRVANDSYMYNTSVPAVSSRKFAPNNCRIITLMFQSAYGTAAAGGAMTVNLDNFKFVIN